MSDKLIELIRSSAVIQGMITLVVCSTWCYLLTAQIPVPSELTNVVYIVLGFYFGGKFQQAVLSSRRGDTP